MSIDIRTLERATYIIFQHLRNNGVNYIEFDQDFYWDINKDQKYDPYKQPTDMTLGQLSDDCKEIEKIASGRKAAIGYDLVWLASLYQYIGENNLG